MQQLTKITTYEKLVEKYSIFVSYCNYRDNDRKLWRIRSVWRISVLEGIAVKDMGCECLSVIVIKASQSSDSHLEKLLVFLQKRSV